MATRDLTGPTQATIKKLFAKSGNRCAFPRCSSALVQGSSIVGEICHIRAASPNGPRYDPQQNSASRHSYENLILLCANHHTVVDSDPEAYTVARLLKMKSDHESSGGLIPENQANRGAKALLINQFGDVRARDFQQIIHIHSSGNSERGENRQATLARLRKFHDDRVTQIAMGASPVPLLAGGLLVMHVVPFSTVDDRHTSSFDDLSQNPARFPPLWDNYPRDSKIDFEGLLTGSNAHGLEEPQRAYVRVFRSGKVEAVASSLARGRSHDCLMLPQIQAMIIRGARIYASSLYASGIEPPLSIFASLVHVRDMRLLQDFIGTAFAEDMPFAVLRNDRLDFTEVVFDTVPANNIESAKLLQPMLRHLANTAGLAMSPYFDADGNYQLNP